MWTSGGNAPHVLVALRARPGDDETHHTARGPAAPRSTRRPQGTLFIAPHGAKVVEFRRAAGDPLERTGSHHRTATPAARGRRGSASEQPAPRAATPSGAPYAADPLSRPGAVAKFSFDAVFAADPGTARHTTQQGLYDAIGAPLVGHCLGGFTTCVMAYGQTGSGKTHTMLGPNGGLSSDTHTASGEAGLAPRLCVGLLDALHAEAQGGVRASSRDRPPRPSGGPKAHHHHHRKAEEIDHDSSRSPSPDPAPAPDHGAPRQRHLRTRVSVSYVQVHGDRPYCLLSGAQQPLRMREHPEAGPFAEGAATVDFDVAADPAVDGARGPTTTYKALLECLKAGTEARLSAATRHNRYSSRSHAILTLRVTRDFAAKATASRGRSEAPGDGEEDGEEHETELRVRLESAVHLVDLAGSERLHVPPGAEDTGPDHGSITANARVQQDKVQQQQRQRFTEAADINSSLAVLGKVIHALAAPKAGPKAGSRGKGRKGPGFVPYRDSTLTWLLRDAFAGRSRTVLIATVSPEPRDADETLGTLRYAAKARTIAVAPRPDETRWVRVRARDGLLVAPRSDDSDADLPAPRRTAPPLPQPVAEASSGRQRSVATTSDLAALREEVRLLREAFESRHPTPAATPRVGPTPRMSVSHHDPVTLDAHPPAESAEAPGDAPMWASAVAKEAAQAAAAAVSQEQHNAAVAALEAQLAVERRRGDESQRLLEALAAKVGVAPSGGAPAAPEQRTASVAVATATAVAVAPASTAERPVKEAARPVGAQDARPPSPPRTRSRGASLDPPAARVAFAEPATPGERPAAELFAVSPPTPAPDSAPTLLRGPMPTPFVAPVGPLPGDDDTSVRPVVRPPSPVPAVLLATPPKAEGAEGEAGRRLDFERPSLGRPSEGPLPPFPGVAAAPGSSSAVEEPTGTGALHNGMKAGEPRPLRGEARPQLSGEAVRAERPLSPTLDSPHSHSVVNLREPSPAPGLVPPPQRAPLLEVAMRSPVEAAPRPGPMIPPLSLGQSHSGSRGPSPGVSPRTAEALAAQAQRRRDLEERLRRLEAAGTAPLVSRGASAAAAAVLTTLPAPQPGGGPQPKAVPGAANNLAALAAAVAGPTRIGRPTSPVSPAPPAAVRRTPEPAATLAMLQASLSGPPRGRSPATSNGEALRSVKPR